MKTIRQWFLEVLPKEVAEKAIKYTPANVIDTESESCQDALVDAFLWDNTEEGDEYWSNIEENLNLSIKE